MFNYIKEKRYKSFFTCIKKIFVLSKKELYNVILLFIKSLNTNIAFDIWIENIYNIRWTTKNEIKS